MTATDIIRAMLDERGVECWDMKTRGVWFGISGREHRFEAHEQTDGLIEVSIYDLTPEQAIEATLGRGECTDTGRYCFTCSECGWTANEPHHAFGGFWPNYCPNCGRKVRV